MDMVVVVHLEEDMGSMDIVGDMDTGAFVVAFVFLELPMLYVELHQDHHPLPFSYSIL